MKGYISIDIPTQPYIAAFIKNLMGEKPKMNGLDNYGIGKFFLLMLRRKTNERRLECGNKHNTTKLRVYVDWHTFKHRGHCINETNLRHFNQFVKDVLKTRFHEKMDHYFPICENINVSLAFTRRDLQISDDDWNDESMKRDYHRYRHRNGLPILKKGGGLKENYYPKCPLI